MKYLDGEMKNTPREEDFDGGIKMRRARDDKEGLGDALGVKEQ